MSIVGGVAKMVLRAVHQFLHYGAWLGSSSSKSRARTESAQLQGYFHGAHAGRSAMYGA